MTRKSHNFGTAFNKLCSRRVWRKGSSVHWKIVILLIFISILINITVAGMIRHTFSHFQRQAFEQNLINLMDYILVDLGEPPTLSAAKTIALKRGMQIRYRSADSAWATSENLPQFAQIHEYRRPWLAISPTISASWRENLFLFHVQSASGELLFASEMAQSWRPPGRNLFGILTVLTLIILITYLAIRRIFSPLKSLMQGVQQVSMGDLNSRIPVKSQDELGQLAESFNAMTEKLQQRIEAGRQLLWDVSHELRSPLTRMRLALEFLPTGKTQESLLEDLHEMDKMIEDLMQSERLDSPYGALKYNSFDLLTMLRALAESYPNRPPGIVFKPEVHEFLVSADENFLKIACRNVLENALKYSSASSQPVEIHVAKNENNFYISIQDFGEGIPAAEQTKLFEPFYRIDKSRSKASGGFGLGLSLCKKIVTKHQGRIEVKSEVGQGTTMKIVIPLRTNL